MALISNNELDELQDFRISDVVPKVTMLLGMLGDFSFYQTEYAMKLVQVIGILLFFVAINGAVVYRLWRLMPSVRWLRFFVVLLLLALIVAPFFVMAWGELIPLSVVTFLYMAGTSWVIALIYLILLFVLIDGLRLFGLKALNKFTIESWVGILTFAALLVALGVYGYQNYNKKERVELNLSIEKAMPRALRMVVVSDLHLGYSIGREELVQWVAMINSEDPDVVLLVGDVIDASLRPLDEERMAEVLRTLKSRYGVYAVPGNHEHYATLPKSAAFFREANVRFICDESVLVDNRCVVVGRDDWSNKKRQSLSSLVGGLDRTKPIVVLDHQPRAFGEAAGQGVDVQFCGHTHHGQIWPVSWLVEQMYEQAYGYRRYGRMQSYVSSGLGIWGGKFRIGTTSEYVVVTLRQR